jgi:hypothetical protein
MLEYLSKVYGRKDLSQEISDIQGFYCTSLYAERVLGQLSVLTNVYRAAEHFSVPFQVTISSVSVNRKT